jgi:sulfate permease, SulP family
VIGLKLVNVAGIREIWRLSRDEFWVAAATAAVLIGVGVTQRTVLAIGLAVYRFGVGVFYANAERFSEEITALVDVPEPHGGSS